MTTPLIFSKVHGRLTKVLGRLIFFISTFFPCPCKVGSSLENVNFFMKYRGLSDRGFSSKMIETFVAVESQHEQIAKVMIVSKSLEKV